MTQDVKYCFDDDEPDHVADNMADIRVRRLPVVNRDKLPSSTRIAGSRPPSPVRNVHVHHRDRQHAPRH